MLGSVYPVTKNAGESIHDRTDSYCAARWTAVLLFAGGAADVHGLDESPEMGRCHSGQRSTAAYGFSGEDWRPYHGTAGRA